MNEVVGGAVAAAHGLGLRQYGSGRWAADVDEVRWEIDVLSETAYGDGVFRVGWGVRVPNLSRLIGLDEIEGTIHATVGGDAGSLATRSRRMFMLCVEGGSVGIVNRVLWQIKPTSSSTLIAQISSWLRGPLADVFASMSTRRGVVGFLENYERQYGRYGQHEVHPDSKEAALAVIAGVKALDGDKAGALAALEQWRALIGEPGTRSYKLISSRIDESRRHIEAL